MKIANRQARAFVEEKMIFTANNIFSENYGRLYIVYSYGHHWPMFVFDRVAHLWYENRDKYSCTTSKHRTQTVPLYVETIKLSLAEIKELTNTVNV